jgi:Neuraminidase (sialidase)
MIKTNILTISISYWISKINEKINLYIKIDFYKKKEKEKEIIELDMHHQHILMLVRYLSEL